MNKSSLKIFKSSKEKSPMDKSSLKFFKIAMEKSLEWTSRKNLHISNEKSPWINLFFSNLQDNFSKKKKKISNFQGKISSE